MSNDSSVQGIVEGFFGGAAIERRSLEAVGANHRDLAVVQVHDALRVSHERGGIGRDKHFLFADAEHDRAAIAGDDDGVRSLGVDDASRKCR